MTQVLRARHIIDEIVLDEHGHIVEHPSRKSVPDVDDKSWPAVLKVLKDKRFFKQFCEKNLDLTKNQVRDSVSRDLFILQAVSAIEEIDRSANMHSKRLREWAAWWVPELEAGLSDHAAFARIVSSKAWNELLDESHTKSDQSMGSDISPKDVLAIKAQAMMVEGIFSSRDQIEIYLKSSMQELCPNLTILAGHLIGAKLLARAGSLKRLSEIPSSTIQLLGAEKALFRHLVTGAKPPKYGVIYSHPIVQSVKRSDQGKAARALADKISIAVKVDYFKGEPIGESLKKALEARFKR